jgi:hypothetical protein
MSLKKSIYSVVNQTKVNNSITFLFDLVNINLSDNLSTKFNQLREDQKELLNQVLVNRNGLIVEYNERISAMLGCNTNVSILGSEEQAKSTLCYLLKYVTKPPTEITHSISLIHHARRTIERYPSVAEYSGTHKRTAICIFLTELPIESVALSKFLHHLLRLLF